MFRGLFQPMHLLIILAIALVVMGPSKLPELGKGLGEALKGFKKALSGDEKDELIETKNSNQPDSTEKKV